MAAAGWLGTGSRVCVAQRLARWPRKAPQRICVDGLMCLYIQHAEMDLSRSHVSGGCYNAARLKCCCAVVLSCGQLRTSGIADGWQTMQREGGTWTQIATGIIRYFQSP
jgi:hypothetical protein